MYRVFDCSDISLTSIFAMNSRIENTVEHIRNIFISQIDRKPLVVMADNIHMLLDQHDINVCQVLYYLFNKNDTANPLDTTLLGFLCEYNESSMDTPSLKKVKLRFFDLYLTAAEQGFALGQYFVGRCFMCHINCFGKINEELDVSKPIHYFEKAARCGNARAQFEMAVYYEHYKNDVRKALYWYKKSEQNGFYQAPCCLGVLYKDELKKGIGKDLHLAIWFFRKSMPEDKTICLQLLKIFKIPHSMDEDFSRW